MEAFRYQSLKVFAKDLWNQLEIPAPIPTTPANQPSWVYIFQGGGRKLRIRTRKVKDLVNNVSILAIFSLK